MRRWTLLLAGAALWLFLAAIPALADGGPHVALTNSGAGSGGLTADSCAGCHRAHTAQGEMLLIEEESTLCLVCHGAGATGATTNVVNGVQLVPGNDPVLRNPDGVILGALRNGGFTTAAIGSGSAYRLAYASGGEVRQLPKVPVRAVGGELAVQAVTSAHIDLDRTAGTSLATAWGNIDGTAGTTFSSTPDPGGIGKLTCGSCHNPHGNNQYRILQEIPDLIAPNGFDAADTKAFVTDAPLPPATTTRNYTVIQTKGGTGTLTASQVQNLTGYSNLMGDYLHRRVPWNASSGSVFDAPNGIPATDASAGTVAFNEQITAWCSQCHSRYLATTAAPYETDSGDAIFKYRHPTTRNQACVTCHVAHGSNAQMDASAGTAGFQGYSANMTYPGGAAAPAGDSRLLKADNRGTCQLCHDPTGTIDQGDSVGPIPVPFLP